MLQVNKAAKARQNAPSGSSGTSSGSASTGSSFGGGGFKGGNGNGYSADNKDGKYIIKTVQKELKP